MNSIKLYGLIILLAVTLCGCKEEYNPSTTLQPSLTGRFLKVSQTTFNHLSSDSFKDEFSVDCSEASWKFNLASDWFTVSPTSGNSSSKISLEGKENSSTEARTEIFYLVSDDAGWNYQKSLSVSQGGLDASLTVEPTEVSFKGAGEKKNVLIIANCEWRAVCSQEWVALDVIDSNELSISASPNPSDSYREAVVYVNYGENKTVSVAITQFPAEISASDAVLKFSNHASKYSIDVDSEIDWSAEASESWISVNPAYGSTGKTKVSIEVAPNATVNDREGYVAFKTGEYERFQIAIKQEGLFIEADSEITFRSSESSQNIEIKCNTDWEVLSSPDWLSFSLTKGNGNSTITVTASENKSSDSRKGTVEIGQKGLTLSCTVEVTQLGRTLETGQALLEFDDRGGVQTFELLSDGVWSSICSEDWFSATPVSGVGDDLISVSVEENTGENEREGKIIYTFGNQTSEVIVNQSGKYFNIDNDTFKFGSKGGSHTISLSTNEQWKAEITDDVDWVTLSAASGIGGAEITVTANDNPSVNSRSAEILITPENSQAVKITITQSARYLRVSAENITFFSDGGTSSFISIDTDGEYEISSDASWFDINQENESGFTVSTNAYKLPETREGKITIFLTDLEEGSLSLEIPVIQIGEGCSFVLDGYSEDDDWNDFGNTTISFSIDGYSVDQDWNTKYQSKIIINITGYKEEENWNTKEEENFDFSKDDFSSEEDWNDKI